jgi:hypothetical protein
MPALGVVDVVLVAHGAGRLLIDSKCSWGPDQLVLMRTRGDEYPPFSVKADSLVGVTGLIYKTRHEVKTEGTFRSG